MILTAVTALQFSLLPVSQGAAYQPSPATSPRAEFLHHTPSASTSLIPFELQLQPLRGVTHCISPRWDHSRALKVIQDSAPSKHSGLFRTHHLSLDHVPEAKVKHHKKKSLVVLDGELRSIHTNGMVTSRLMAQDNATWKGISSSNTIAGILCPDGQIVLNPKKRSAMAKV